MKKTEVDEEAEETQNDARHDARQYYYRIWGRCSLAAMDAYHKGDYSAYRRAIDILFDYVQPFFTETEFTEIDNLLTTAREKESSISVLDNRAPSVQRVVMKKRAELDRQLRTALRLIFRRMKEHNMLLPRGSTNNEFDEDGMFSQSDL